MLGVCFVVRCNSFITNTTTNASNIIDPVYNFESTYSPDVVVQVMVSADDILGGLSQRTINVEASTCAGADTSRNPDALDTRLYLFSGGAGETFNRHFLQKFNSMNPLQRKVTYLDMAETVTSQARGRKYLHDAMGCIVTRVSGRCILPSLQTKISVE